MKTFLEDCQHVMQCKQRIKPLRCGMLHAGGLTRFQYSDSEDGTKRILLNSAISVTLRNARRWKESLQCSSQCDRQFAELRNGLPTFHKDAGI